jgi:hypothetical protein
MTGRSRLAAIVGALVLTLFPALPVVAHDPSPIFEGDGLWAPDADLTFDWSDAWMAPFDMRVAIKAGAADANASRGSRAATFRALDGAKNRVVYGTEVVCGTGGLACMRRNPPTGFGLWFRENGHRFDWGTLRWCQLYDPFPNGCYDVENITLDELGHVEVLDHHANYPDGSDFLDSVVQTVSHAKPGVGWNAHAFGRCDVAQLQRQYDVTTTTRISTCLDAIPTMLSFSASAGSVAWDGSVRLTARLRIQDDPTVTFRLRGNDLDGRTVVLQRRPPGGTWVDAQVLTATGTPGTYAANLRLRSTTEFRAVFRKPDDEPLLAVTSSTVRVTVTGGCSLPPCPQSMPRTGER